MVKKSARRVIRLKGKKPSSPKKNIKKKSKTKNADSKSSKLDKILNVEKKLLQGEQTITQKENLLAKEEEKIEGEEKRIETEEKDITTIKQELSSEGSDLEKIKALESEIKDQVGEHPLAEINFKDVVKGMVGAFIGLAIHYTFVYGVEISNNLTMTRATVLFPVTFVVGLLFIYATGFRKVKDSKILMFMPLRLFILYISALIMSIVVLYVFYPNFGHSFSESYKMVAGVMLAAVVGACTADLIGKD